MATIAENLQTLVDHKAAIKAALENQGKEPTEALGTYAGLIDTLENPEDVTYCVTVDGENKAFAQLYGQEKVTLTATANDIRQNTSAITDTGYTEGTKDIPAYHTETGKKYIAAGKAITLNLDKYDYTYLQVILTKFNSSISNSVEAYAVVIEDAVYQANSTTKLADIAKDDSTQTINLGITADETTVLRYFTMREER